MSSRSWSTGPATLVYTYDGAKRPIGETSGTAIVMGRTYDLVGNVTTETQNIQGANATQNGTQTFLYDALNRVTSGTLGSIAKAYTYDHDSNRLTVTVNGVTTDAFAFDATDETISDTLGTTPNAFAYDQYGNLTSSSTSAAGSTTYAYDFADRLNSITQADGSSVGFTFDAAGRHATRTGTTGGVTVTLDTYSYLGSTDSVIVDVSTAGTGNTLNAAIDSMGDRLATAASNGFAWIVPDLHGNVAAQCGSSGSITDVFRYDAYGNIIGTSTFGSVPSPWRYQGRILESTAGSDTYDFGARAYVPDLGTFTSLDSVSGSAQNPLSLNRYLYADANPATLVDPDGHCAAPGGECSTSQTCYTSYESGFECTYNYPVTTTKKKHGGSNGPGSESSGSGSGNSGSGSGNSGSGSGGGPDCHTTPAGTTCSDGSGTADGSPPPAGRPDCGMNPFCDVNNAVGTLGDLDCQAMKNADPGWPDSMCHPSGTLYVVYVIVAGSVVVCTLGSAACASAVARALGAGGTVCEVSESSCQDLAANAAKGKDFENAVLDKLQLVKNTLRVAAKSGDAKYRIPDAIDPLKNTVYEIKNVAYMSLTSQIQDEIDYATSLVPPAKFVLVVNQATEIAPTLQKAIDDAGGTIQRFP